METGRHNAARLELAQKGGGGGPEMRKTKSSDGNSMVSQGKRGTLARVLGLRGYDSGRHGGSKKKRRENGGVKSTVVATVNFPLLWGLEEWGVEVGGESMLIELFEACKKGAISFTTQPRGKKIQEISSKRWEGAGKLEKLIPLQQGKRKEFRISRHHKGG